jgi:hypothetical protein
MNNPNIDQTLLLELSRIRQFDLGLYLSVKQNIDAVYKKMYVREAEDVFYGKAGGAEYEKYEVAEACRALFIRHYGLNAGIEDRCLIYKKKDMAYAAIYTVNGRGFFTGRTNIYSMYAIREMFQTFGDRLIPSNPEEAERKAGQAFDDKLDMVS